MVEELKIILEALGTASDAAADLFILYLVYSFVKFVLGIGLTGFLIYFAYRVTVFLVSSYSFGGRAYNIIRPNDMYHNSYERDEALDRLKEWKNEGHCNG